MSGESRFAPYRMWLPSGVQAKHVTFPTSGPLTFWTFWACTSGASASRTRATRTGMGKPPEIGMLSGSPFHVDTPQFLRSLVLTVTGNWQVAWLPAKSVAVQVTVVVPRGKRLPEGGTHTTLGVGSSSSSAVTVKVTTSALLDAADATPLEGQAIVGGVVSGQPHLARKLSPESGALVKYPPAWSAGPVRSLKTARAATAESVPLPRADQLEPFHFARCCAARLPAVVKVPPA